MVLMVIALMIGLLAVGARAANPILPGTAFIPDGEPHVFEFNGQKRVFLYGSRDERVTAYCGYGHDAWSASVDDLTHWTCHGEIFNVQQVKDIGYGVVDEQHFGAPDCVYNPVTKKYYFYTFLGKPYEMDGKEGPLPSASNAIPGFEKFGPKCVMAVSDSPAGPFVKPVMCDWPAANSAGTFDPSVLVDEQADGSVRVYAFWGMKQGDRWAELDPVDMHTIIDPQTRKPDRNAWHKTLGESAAANKSSLFEASSIKKIAKDKYVFICSASERHSALTYYYGNSPAGPWNYGGKIIDNATTWNGGNNHGSIADVNGQWYVFYHRATSNDFNRQAMIEPIHLKIDGDKVNIPPVQMTSQGTQTDGLNAYQRYNAGIACYHSAKVHIDGAARNSDGLNPIVGITGKQSAIGYKFLNFGPTAVTNSDDLQLRLNIALLATSTLDVKVCLPNQAGDASKLITIASFDLKNHLKPDGDYREITLPIAKLDQNEPLRAIGGLKGKLAMYLAFSGEDQIELCRLKEFEFAKGSAPTPNPLNSITLKSEGNSLTALPARGRPGDSIQLIVTTPPLQRLKNLTVKDSTGRVIDITKNPTAPYAKETYSFTMPNSAVTVDAQFESTGNQ